MATFVEIEPDAFNESFKAIGASSGSGAGDNGLDIHRQSNVRRPVRGIQIKDDVYASIQVRTADGRCLPLFDAAGTAGGPNSIIGTSNSNSNFLIQAVKEQRVEKQQVVLTFGAPYIFFFGEQPRIINVTGVLLNTEDFNWRAEWWQNYDQFLRGTQCVSSRSRVYLAWDDIIVEGYILGAEASEDASNRNLVTFQFQMFLTNYENVSSIGDPFGHLNNKAINLDPNTVDFLTSIGQGGSTTLAVRQANINDNSMLQNLRDDTISSVLGSGTARLSTINGQVVDLLQQAQDFIAGRNIQVPTGASQAGSAEVATAALASFPAAQAVISGQSGNELLPFGSLKLAIGESRTLPASDSIMSVAAVYGSLANNIDEFVSRYVQPTYDKIKAPAFDSSQQGNTNTPDAAVTAALAELRSNGGVQTDAMSDDTRNQVNNLQFGVSIQPPPVSL